MLAKKTKNGNNSMRLMEDMSFAFTLEAERIASGSVTVSLFRLRRRTMQRKSRRPHARAVLPGYHLLVPHQIPPEAR